jgi:hypothetical protein
MEDLIKRFFIHFNSGGAASVAIPVLHRLLCGLPLSPLTGDDDEWADPLGDGKLLQNKRCSSVFKIASNGLTFDVDAALPQAPLAFPYWSERRNLSPLMQVTKKESANAVV